MCLFARPVRALRAPRGPATQLLWVVVTGEPEEEVERAVQVCAACMRTSALLACATAWRGRACAKSPSFPPRTSWRAAPRCAPLTPRPPPNMLQAADAVLLSLLGADALGARRPFDALKRLVRGEARTQTCLQDGTASAPRAVARRRWATLGGSQYCTYQQAPSIAAAAGAAPHVLAAFGMSSA